MTRLSLVSAASALFLASASTLADSITLVGGDVLQGTIVAESDASVTLDHAALGRIEVSRERIATVSRTAPAAAEVPSKPKAVLPAPVPPPPAKPDGSWKFALSLGFTGSKNDEASNWDVRTAAEAKRETEDDRTTVTGEYYFKTADGTETDNNLLVKVLEEFLIKDSKWEGFAQVTYQNDNFQAWEQRLGGYAGPGYRLIDEDGFKLKLKGGAGASYEFPTSDWTPELLFGDELVWTIDDRSQFKQGFEIYPDIDEFGEYRFIFRLDYEVALSEKRDLMATIGFRDEYDSYVEADGGTSNDMKIYVGLKYAF
ncbi:MAG: hypothetical protein RLZZ238_2677 [Planctomycetota bacterium]